MKQLSCNVILQLQLTLGRRADAVKFVMLAGKTPSKPVRVCCRAAFVGNVLVFFFLALRDIMCQARRSGSQDSHCRDSFPACFRLACKQHNSKFPAYFYVPVSVAVCCFAVVFQKGVLSTSGSGRVSSQSISCILWMHYGLLNNFSKSQ